MVMHTVKKITKKQKNKNNSKTQVKFLKTSVKKIKNKNYSKTRIGFPKDSVKKIQNRENMTHLLKKSVGR